MSKFDVAFGIDQNTLNSTVKAIYASAYPNIFTGSQNIDILGTNIALKWDIAQAPLLDLHPSSRASEVIPIIIARDLMLRNLVRGDIHTAAAHITPATFKLTFPSITLSLALPGNQVSGTFSADVVCQARIKDISKIELVAIHADINTQRSQLDDFLEAIINPIANNMLDTANKMLKGIIIPTLSFEGITLSPPAVLVNGGRLIALSNLAFKGVPPLADSNWPEDALFALASRDLINEAVRVFYSNGTIPHGVNQSDSIDLGYAKANYNLFVDLDCPSVGINGANFMMYAPIEGRADAGINTFLGHFGVNYKIHVRPKPLGCGFKLSVSSANDLIVTIPSLPGFDISLEPQGNPTELALSQLSAPMLNSITAALSSLLPQMITNFSIPVANIPDIPQIDAGNVHLKIKPKDIRSETFGEMAKIAGGMDIYNV